MASRTSGRGEERPNARSASGTNDSKTRRQGMTGQSSTTDSARQNAAGRTSQTRETGSPQPQSKPAQSPQAQSPQAQSQRPQGQQVLGSTGASASQIRGDQERELRSSREQGNMRPAASTQRGNLGRESGGPGASSWGGGNNPFALMRRMMDDMDRLFSDFGFTHPGMLASSLLNSEHWPSSGQRSLGAGSSGTSNLSAAQRGQQGAQRGAQSGGLQRSTLGSLWSPQVEVFERGDNLVVRADLPGLSRENVDVELDDDALIIRGERRSDVEDEDEGFYRSERSYGSFYRAIPLPEGIDASGCNATFRDGVLEVTLAKPPQQPSRTRRIDVRGA